MTVVLGNDSEFSFILKPSNSNRMPEPLRTYARAAKQLEAIGRRRTSMQGSSIAAMLRLMKAECVPGYRSARV